MILRAYSSSPARKNEGVSCMHIIHVFMSSDRSPILDVTAERRSNERRTGQIAKSRSFNFYFNTTREVSQRRELTVPLLSALALPLLLRIDSIRFDCRRSRFLGSPDFLPLGGWRNKLQIETGRKPEAQKQQSTLHVERVSVHKNQSPTPNNNRTLFCHNCTRIVFIAIGIGFE